MWRDFYASFVGRFSGKRALSQAAEQNRRERFFTAVSATQLYFLAASDANSARWLAEVVAGANFHQWHRVQLRLLSGAWPFDESRTRQWFIEQAELSAASVERFGLPAAEVRTRQQELRLAVSAWCKRFESAFPLVDRIVASGYLNVKDGRPGQINEVS